FPLPVGDDPDGSDLDRDGPPGAMEEQQTVLELLFGAVAAGLPAGTHRLAGIGMDELDERSARHLVGCPARELERAAADEADDTGRVDGHDDVRRVLGQDPIALFGLAELLFEPFALRLVAERALEALQLAVDDDADRSQFHGHAVAVAMAGVESEHALDAGLVPAGRPAPPDVEDRVLVDEIEGRFADQVVGSPAQEAFDPVV